MNPEILIKKRRVSLSRVFCLATVAGIVLSTGFTDIYAGQASGQHGVSVVSQQGTTVTGLVTDHTGEPLPGVNVFIKGTTNGTVTDVNGKYILTVNGADDQIVFSFIGYQTQTIAVDGQNAINVNLTEDARAIEEVVVVGHGTQKKVNLTGATCITAIHPVN